MFESSIFWRGFSTCHDMRNRTEYEGALDVDERLIIDLIASCRKVAERVIGLPCAGHTEALLRQRRRP